MQSSTKVKFYHSLVILLAIANFVVFVGKSEKTIAKNADNSSLTDNSSLNVNSKKINPNSVTLPQVDSDNILDFAAKHLGTPYKSAGKDPKGFDCSGFTYYVYRHFDVPVGRSSRDQVHEGYEVPVEEAREGDLIVFTGTDHTIKTPGHVGIVVENSDDKLTFIHSSSSKKNNGIVVTELNEYYKRRFLQVRRVID